MKLDNVGVCSWSLQVKSIIELEGFTNKLGIKTVQLACGDPHHASWDEGDDMPIKAKSSSFKVTGAMLGFFGEDPLHIATIECAFYLFSSHKYRIYSSREPLNY